MAYYPLATSFEARYRLAGPDGAVAVFNDPFDQSYCCALTEVTGLDSAEVRESAADLTESDGGAHGAFYLGRRPIVLNGKVFGHATVLERSLRIDRARRASLALRGDSTLAWKPATRRENFVVNPSFETGVTWWTYAFTSGLTSTSAVQTTSGPASGTKALAISATQPADTTARTATASSPTGTSGIQVQPGKSYYFTANVNHSNAPASGSTLTIFWWKSDGTASSTASNTSAAVGVNTNGVFNPSVTATAPADAAYASLRYTASTATSGDVIVVYLDALLFTETVMGTTYFDGDTSGYYWQGDAHASASGDFIEQFTTVRRQQPFRESGAWAKDIQIPLVSEFATIFSTSLKTSATGVAAENRGNYPAYPLVNITGGSTNPTISDGTRTFTTTGLTLAGGEVVQFDMLYHTGVFTAGARVGQSANRYINFATTAWPYLAGNGTTQTFTLGGGGSATIQYRDTWA